MHSKQIAKDFFWVGSLDPELRVFDIIMHTEFGTTYNAYLLKGTQKTVLFEASKARCFDEWEKTVREIAPLEKIDVLVVDHTEPDHTGTIERMLEINPMLEIIGTMGAINFLKEIVNREFNARTVKAGDELDIGDATLKFIPAPNLHWPDTMFTYIPEIKILVTCDCFGSHYSDEHITNEVLRDPAGYLRAARYYFDNILGPFKGDVLHALDKIKDLPIDVIAVGHGPVITHAPAELIALYREWAAVRNPNTKKTIVIPYVSAYGYTKQIAENITAGIHTAGDFEVKLFDMVGADFEEVMCEIGFADGFLLGTPTMVSEALPPIWNIATALNTRLHGGKFASAFGSYGWSGEGVPHIMQRLKQLGLNVFGDGFRVRFKPNQEQLDAAYAFGAAFGASVRDGKIADDCVK